MQHEDYYMVPAQTELVYDNDYVRWKTAESTYPMRYRFSTPVRKAIKPVHGARGVGYGVDVTAYNATIPQSTRTIKLKSEEQKVTELYGTAPYLGRGDGIMFNPQMDNELRFSQVFLKEARTRHQIMEKTVRQPDYNTRPLVVQSTQAQGGVSARLDPAYTD